MKAQETRTPVELPLPRRAVIHERDQNEIEQGGVENEDEVVRIPPAVKRVGGDQKPRNPESCAAESKQQREHHCEEERECPGMKKHGRGPIALQPWHVAIRDCLSIHVSSGAMDSSNHSLYLFS